MSKVLGYLILSCVGSWGLVSFIFVPHAAAEVFLGMIVPLLLAIGTIVPVERIYAKNPVNLSSFMTTALLGKMLLYGMYVALVVGLLSFDAVPFAISFTFYFTALHLAEALYFRNMFRTR